MYPKINEYLYIQIASSDAAEAELEYRSRIADMEDEALLIEIPMQASNGRLKKLFIGDELSVYFSYRRRNQKLFQHACTRL